MAENLFNQVSLFSKTLISERCNIAGEIASEKIISYDESFKIF